MNEACIGMDLMINNREDKIAPIRAGLFRGTGRSISIQSGDQIVDQGVALRRLKVVIDIPSSSCSM